LGDSRLGGSIFVVFRRAFSYHPISYHPIADSYARG
jgi:hypothetical protein